MLLLTKKHAMTFQYWLANNTGCPRKIDTIIFDSFTIEGAVSAKHIFMELKTDHSMMRWNLTSKKFSTETEYGVWKLFLCSFAYQSKKIRFRSPGEKNHETLLSKVKSLNGRNFFNNK